MLEHKHSIIDAYKNKYTNPRKSEKTTPEYITVFQDLKQQA
jgi:hypothetical protein